MKGNLELIVGLILKLILKYQISLVNMDDDDDNIKDITRKQALLAWCKMKIPRTFPINNFNKDWNDGRAVACLVPYRALLKAILLKQHYEFASLINLYI